jgi:hypothetical protein
MLMGWPFIEGWSGHKYVKSWLSWCMSTWLSVYSKIRNYPTNGNTFSASAEGQYRVCTILKANATVHTSATWW